MDKNVNPIVALIVIIVFGGLIALNFYCGNLLSESDRLGLMAHHPDGRIVVQFGDDLYKIDPDSKQEKLISLEALGVTDIVGGFGFFSNGDLLVRSGKHSSGFDQSLEKYARIADSKNQQSNGSQLVRCNIDLMRCVQFSKKLPDQNRTFRVFIDSQTDTVYLADTTRLRILKLDSTGELLAIREGFKFPNQLKLVDGQLWVADTNNNRVIQLSIETESFGNTVFQKNVRSGNRRWPMDFAHFDGNWLVLLMDNEMAGGRVIQFDQNWEKTKSFKLPKYSDPLGVLVLNDTIFINDFRHTKIYQFDLNGNRLVDFDANILKKNMDATRQYHFKLRLINFTIWLIFALLTIIGFIVGFYKIDENKFESSSVNNSKFVKGNEMPLVGIAVRPLFLYRALPYINAAIIFILLILISSLLVKKGINSFGYNFSFFVISLFVFKFMILKILFRLSKYRMTIKNGSLEIIDYSGFRWEESFEDILWAERAVKVGELVVPLSVKNTHGLFPRAIMKEWLIPQLSGERKINRWSMFKYQWRSPDGILKLGVGSIFFMLVVLAVAEFMEVVSV